MPGRPPPGPRSRPPGPTTRWGRYQPRRPRAPPGKPSSRSRRTLVEGDGTDHRRFAMDVDDGSTREAARCVRLVYHYRDGHDLTTDTMLRTEALAHMPLL